MLAAAVLAVLFAAPGSPPAATATGAASAAPSPTTPAEALYLTSGQSITVIETDEVGAPLERAIPGKAYERAAAADSALRWSEAEALYRDAITEWNTAAHLDPAHPPRARAFELAVAKAERERRGSQWLAGRARTAATNGDPLTASARRAEALEEARLLRAKLMATRAVLGRVSPALYALTRARLAEAMRARDPAASASAPAPAPLPGDAEIHLLLCATRAAAGQPEAARLARAHVTEAERADPANLLALGACAAALGETRAALAALEIIALHPGPSRGDRFSLRDLYISNDWDRLRGDPRFEGLFPR